MSDDIELFPDEEEWKKEWIGMPEFKQKKVVDKPYAQINFKFATKEDLDAFAKLIGQTLTNKTKSARIPAIERGLDAYEIYE